MWEWHSCRDSTVIRGRNAAPTPIPQRAMPLAMRDPVPKIKILLFLVLLALPAGCGYHSVSRTDPMQGANGVNVVLFANRSYRPGVEGVLGRQLLDEVALRTGGKVLPGDRAELELTGVVLSYATAPVSFTAADVIREYQATLKVQATLRQRLSQKILWKGEISESQVYPSNETIPLQQNAEAAAVEKICRRIAEDVWLKIGERF